MEYHNAFSGGAKGGGGNGGTSARHFFLKLVLGILANLMRKLTVRYVPFLDRHI